MAKGIVVLMTLFLICFICYDFVSHLIFILIYAGS